MGQAHDPLDDGGVVGVVGDAVHEGLVDLQGVDRQQGTQLAQRGVAHAEVVDRKAHAEGLERGERLADRAGVGHHRRLGDLQAQPARRDARVREGRADDVDQVGRAELAGRHVDRHAERVVTPGGELPARLAQDPRPDGDDEPVALGQRDEAQRRDDAEDRVVPAQERLDAADAAVVERDQRLVDEVQLAVVERVAQAALELETLHRTLAHRVVEDLAARLAHLLGAVHRRVGVAQQRVRIMLAGSAEADANTGGHVAALAVEHERLVQGLGQAARHPERVGLAGDAGQQDGELVAAEAGDDVARSQDAAQPLGHAAEEAIAGAVAERVVDDLEVVEVDEQHGDAPLGAQRAAQAREEELAVGQARERVVVGLPGELVLGEPALGDVDAVADPRLGATVATGEQRVVPQPPRRGLGVAHLDLATVGGERAAAEVVGIDEFGQRPAGRVGADAPAERGVGALDHAVEAGEGHADRRIVEGVAEALAAVHRVGARVLVEPPVHDVDDAERGDEERVDARPAPRVRDGVGVVVDRGRLERPHEPVVAEDEGEGQQVREPVLVEGEDADHHEEVEMALDGAVHQVHDDRRRRQQPDAHRDSATAARDAPARGDDGTDRDRARVDGRVPHGVPGQQPPGEETARVRPHEPEHPGMAALPYRGRQGPTPGQGATEARERSHRPVVGVAPGFFMQGPARADARVDQPRRRMRESSGSRLVTRSASRCSRCAWANLREV